MIHTDGKPTIANTRLSAATDPNLLRKYPILDTCPCAECSENPDPDSMPGGYDNPRDYEWEDFQDDPS